MARLISIFGIWPGFRAVHVLDVLAICEVWSLDGSETSIGFPAWFLHP